MALILVIEDNEINVELVSFLLQAAGHRTVCAADGPAGLALARRQRPDLVLCDIQLPGLDGHGVAAALRADPQLCRVPLVAVTAAAMVGDRERALAAGFDDHVAKPIDPRHFVARVESFLQHLGPPAVVPAVHDGGRAAAPVPESLRAPRPGLVLLMVDDKAHHLEFKRDLLEPAGYGVICAPGAEAAWQLLAAQPVDLVLSDVVMPGMGGFELLARVRADARWRRLPFVFLTSTACDSRSMQDGLALGADDYLMRPLEPATLLRVLRRSLSLPGQR